MFTIEEILQLILVGKVGHQNQYRLSKLYAGCGTTDIVHQMVFGYVRVMTHFSTWADCWSKIKSKLEQYLLIGWLD